MRVFAIINQKGGCGKTTTAINLAAAFAESGKRTLLVDMDPQSHCALGLNVPETRMEGTIEDPILAESLFNYDLDEILWQISSELYLAPSSVSLAGIEQQLARREDRDLRLKKVLGLVENDFDIAIIDCPPSVGLLTFNALRAADDVIIPVETGFFSLQGSIKQATTLQVMAEKYQHHVRIHILPNMYDVRMTISRDIHAEMKRYFGTEIVAEPIHYNAKLKEAASYGQPIFEYEPGSRGTEDYEKLVQWLSERNQPVNSLNKAQAKAKPQPVDVAVGAEARGQKGGQSPSRKEPQPGKASQSPSESQPGHASPVGEGVGSGATSSEPTQEQAKARPELIIEVQPLSEQQVTLNSEMKAQKADSADGLAVPVPKASRTGGNMPGIGSGSSITTTGHGLVSPVTVPGGGGGSSNPGTNPGTGSSGTSAASMGSSYGGGATTSEMTPKTGLSRAAELVQRTKELAKRTAAMREQFTNTDDIAKYEQENQRKNLPPADDLSKLNTRQQISSFFGVKATQHGILFVQPDNGQIESIAVAGEFNQWSPTAHPMRKNERLGVWVICLPLPAGKHRYRLVVDGQWRNDPHNHHVEANPFGELNSVVEVN